MEEQPVILDAVSNRQSANRRIARAAGTVMAAFVFCNLVSLVRQIVVLKAFGTSAEMDAFNVANRVSETLFTLIAGGALGSAFIPTFTGLLARSERAAAWRLASSVANLVLVVLSTASLVAAICAPQIVRYLIAPGFARNPAQETLAVALLRLMLPSAAIFGLSGLVMGILNSHQVFLIPALTPSMYWLGIIFGVSVLSPRLGIYGPAWGVLLGAALHLGLQIPALLRQRPLYTPTFGLRTPAVRQVVRLMVPRLFGVAVVQLNFWVNAWLASRLSAGSYTALFTAFQLMLMPQAAIAQSVATAALPTFSAQFALGKLDEMRSALAASLRGVLLLAAPASLGLILLRQPVVAALYQRGEFTARSTEMVAWALLWYGAGLVGHAMVEILARAFYALHDTKTPVIVGATAMALNVCLSLAFTALFQQWNLIPLGGLALANSLATAIEMVGLLVLMRRRLIGLEEGRLFTGAWQAGAATLVMGAVIWVWLQLASALTTWLIVAGAMALGGALYGSVLWLMGADEARLVLRWVSQKFFRAPNRLESQ
jgi:putative peptidoglycan lipid II flippase